MTGFARSSGAADGVNWVWEVRSVNGRGLDVRLRLPPGFDGLEAAVREAAASRFNRGNVSATLTVERLNGTGTIRLNENVLADVIKAAKRAAELSGGALPDTAALLGFKGVLESNETHREDEAERAKRERHYLQSCEHALDKLSEARRAEGARLAATIGGQIDEISRLANEVRSSRSRTPQAIQEQIKTLIQRVMDSTSSFDPDRLHQEAILAATRADVEEELARLDAHVAAARELLRERGAVGRRFDFLTQEFNREANTLCSKSNAVDITRLGLALKTVIDQMREQVQNIE